MRGKPSRAKPIRANSALYIKLGAGGALEDLCISDGSLRLDYRRIPEALARDGSHRVLSDFCVKRGITTAKPTAGIHAGIIRNFFDTQDDVLWITFANGLLYWCFANSGVTYLGPDDADRQGCFRRDSRGGWQSQSIFGQDLRISELNGELTKVSAFRMAICRLSNGQTRYLLAKINGDDLPQVRAARVARTNLEETLGDLIRTLSWRDFELLVELIFSRSGWRRISSLGGAKKTTDIDLVLPTTGVRAFVQVKAETSQTQLIEYAEKFKLYERSTSKETGSHCFFYVYHTAKRPLRSPSAEITIWGPRDVSRLVIDSGLTDWLIQKVG